MRIAFTIAFVVLGSALVSGQLVTETSGESGELCGKHHNCLSNSTCSRAKQNYVCVCPEPLIGNAKLGCVEKDFPTVFIQADPHMKNLYHQFVSVPTPCRYRVMEYYFEDRFLARVYADNYLYKGGEFYANRIEARIAVSSEPFNRTTGPDKDQLTWLSVLIEGDTISEGQYQFKEWRKVESANWTMPSEETRFMADGSEIITEYDTVNNFAVIKIARVGLRMWFRPADKFVLERNSNFMPQVPGVVISVESPIPESTQFSEADLSSTPDGPDLYQYAQALEMSINMYAVFLTLLVNQLDQIESYCPECDQANVDFIKLCVTDDIQVASINTCGHLYTDHNLLSCISDKNMSETFLPHIFGDCLFATCGNSKQDCQALKFHINRIGCEAPQAVRDLDCDSLSDDVTISNGTATAIMEHEEAEHNHTPYDRM